MEKVFHRFLGSQPKAKDVPRLAVNDHVHELDPTLSLCFRYVNDRIRGVQFLNSVNKCMQGTDVQLSEARQGRCPGVRDVPRSGEEDRRFDDQALSGAKCGPRRDTTHRLVGEVAVRNAQQRLRMDELQSVRPPQSTEDIARNRQVNLYGDESP